MRKLAIVDLMSGSLAVVDVNHKQLSAHRSIPTMLKPLLSGLAQPSWKTIDITFLSNNHSQWHCFHIMPLRVTE
jgi:hypothetical protein